jgi:hypothetical protein
MRYETELKSGFRKQKWTELESVCKFDFPSVRGVRLNYKEVCLRLHSILHSDTVFPRCHRCMRFSCHTFCLEDRRSKVVVDVGNKYTWVISPSFGIRRHFTMFGIPRLSPNDSSTERFVALSSAFYVHTHQVLLLKLTSLKAVSVIVITVCRSNGQVSWHVF